MSRRCRVINAIDPTAHAKGISVDQFDAGLNLLHLPVESTTHCCWFRLAEIGQKLPFASGSYVSRHEIVVTEKWSRQLDKFAKTRIEAGSSNTWCAYSLGLNCLS